MQLLTPYNVKFDFLIIINMLIFVRLMTGRNLTLDVESSDFAGKVKDMIYDREGIPWDR